MRYVAFMLVWLMLAMPLAGCLGADDDVAPVDEGPEAYPNPWERGDLIYDDSDVFSRVTVNGTRVKGSPFRPQFFAGPVVRARSARLRA